MIKLNKDTVQLLHQFLIDEFGGTHGLRDDGMLESALAMPFMTFDGLELYPTLEQKAAQLCFGLLKNHPFVDGNKRIAALCMEMLLELNGTTLHYTCEEELANCILAVVKDEMNTLDLVFWIHSHNEDKI